jgi:acyl carrier protein
MLRYSNKYRHISSTINTASPYSRSTVLSTRELIEQQFTSIAESRNKTLPPLTDDLRLADTGLDSLGLAVIVAQLEDMLRFDPFDKAVARFPVTFGDFVHLYQSRRP